MAVAVWRAFARWSGSLPTIVSERCRRAGSSFRSAGSADGLRSRPADARRWPVAEGWLLGRTVRSRWYGRLIADTRRCLAVTCESIPEASAGHDVPVSGGRSSSTSPARTGRSRSSLYYPGDDLFRPHERRRGRPIGNLTSQLFANVYLDRFDDFGTEAWGAVLALRGRLRAVRRRCGTTSRMG